MSVDPEMADTAVPSTFVDYLEKLKCYMKTTKGFILTAEIIISLIIVVCYGVSLHAGYTALAAFEMFSSIAFFIIFWLELDKKFQKIDWVWVDLFRTGIAVLVFIITSLICVINGTGARIIGGVFGLIAGLVYAYDAFTILQHIKSSKDRTEPSIDEGA
ncbi:proteolipid protein 2-like [Cynoglossus semilaevis]|uniref:proteolipid protein 2-like n=1 Tax=Cynoglossus semilaevis TaxID=244447 RepID=UPI00049738C9|nr:proteolipid protein 2-like [Cynoglossus semilaevis]XP_008336367.1 proteolipid protein 2-like [Cynoglossus semilaevis]